MPTASTLPPSLIRLTNRISFGSGGDCFPVVAQDQDEEAIMRCLAKPASGFSSDVPNSRPLRNQPVLDSSVPSRKYPRSHGSATHHLSVLTATGEARKIAAPFRWSTGRTLGSTRNPQNFKEFPSICELTSVAQTYDPAQVLSNAKTVIANTVGSPVFDATTTYRQGGVDVGTTQYIDAYQRANFSGSVQSQPTTCRWAAPRCWLSRRLARRRLTEETEVRSVSPWEWWTSTGSIHNCRASSASSPRSSPARW